MTVPLHVAFVAGTSGAWAISDIVCVTGETLPRAKALAVYEGSSAAHRADDATWVLRGVVSNERYVTRQERDALESRQQPLGRRSATRAVLIPVRKSPQWWALTQDERREIFEERSRHIGIGIMALPEVARRLHHSRDLGEPFDFLTWFEFAPEHAGIFDGVLTELRATDEWRYVDREVEIRLDRL